MSTTFLHSAAFVYWYCGLVLPVVLAIGIYANVCARLAARDRRHERIANGTSTARDHRR